VHFREQNLANSLYFSLLAGNSGGEGLAPDCALRQLVLAAEKMPASCSEIRETCPYFEIFARKEDWGEWTARDQVPSICSFFSGRHMRSPVSVTFTGEGNAITNR
jgi:hypothetical protein